MIYECIVKRSGLTKENMSKKLLCFKANGVNAFQGGRIGITKQIKDVWTPFSMGVHKINLVVQSLVDLIFIAQIEIFMMNIGQKTLFTPFINLSNFCYYEHLLGYGLIGVHVWLFQSFIKTTFEVSKLTQIFKVKGNKL